MNNIIPIGKGKKLFLYSNMRGSLAWCKTPSEFRELTGVKNGLCIRVAQQGIDAPSGFSKQGGLANDAITKNLTMSDLINFLSP